ncbi:hypothetical protein DPMN_081792 [Dreissena polymorpha]|uniref:Uncharacterized protein n=1 Tax=Dreissena polymorpha TaxID=45954 RepID=A0A9D3Y9I0_DREPO|nr:hypothetical protein DPMN_081792 [Dreissena polymorpha]
MLSIHPMLTIHPMLQVPVRQEGPSSVDHLLDPQSVCPLGCGAAPRHVPETSHD